MSDKIERFLPYEGQKNWGDAVNKSFKLLDNKVKSVQDDLAKRQEELKPMVYLSSGVVGYPTDAKNITRHNGNIVTEEIKFEIGDTFSFNYDCYFSDDGNSIPLLINVELSYQFSTIASEDLTFVPVFLKYNKNVDGLVEILENPMEVIQFEKEIINYEPVAHPWYILIGVVKKSGEQYFYIPKVSNSNKTFAEKTRMLLEPKIATNRLSMDVKEAGGDLTFNLKGFTEGFEIEEWDFEKVYGEGEFCEYEGRIYVSKTNDNIDNQPDLEGFWEEQTDAIRYLLVAEGINYPNINFDVFAFESKSFLFIDDYKINKIKIGEAESYIVGRILIGNNKDFIVQYKYSESALNQAEVRGTSFPNLPRNYLYGDYVEVAKFTREATTGPVPLYNSLIGGTPVLGVPNLILSADNVIEQEKLKLEVPEGGYYIFKASEINGSTESPTELTVHGNDGSHILTGQENGGNLTIGNKKLILSQDVVASRKITAQNLVINDTSVFTKRMTAKGGIAVGDSETSETTITRDNSDLVLKRDAGTGSTLTLGLSSVESNNQIEAPSFNAKSDRRLKKEIQPAVLKSISDIPVYTYKLKDTNETQIGIMAQDLLKIAPELVAEDDKGFYSIKESKLIYLLMQEVKELKKEIQDLKR